MKEPKVPAPPVVIGLLGGIASGKSTVAGILAELGFRVLDADAAAREVMATDECKSLLRTRFGDGIFDTAGALDRAALADVAFTDAAARTDLEAIVHPAVRARLLEALRATVAAGTSVALDVPLLLERGLIEECDFTLFLDAAESVREARAAARGWEPGELRRREAAQAPLAAKRSRSAAVIRTDGSADDTRAAVAAVLRQLR